MNGVPENDTIMQIITLHCICVVLEQYVTASIIEWTIKHSIFKPLHSVKKTLFKSELHLFFSTDKREEM